MLTRGSYGVSGQRLEPLGVPRRLLREYMGTLLRTHAHLNNGKATSERQLLGGALALTEVAVKAECWASTKLNWNILVIAGRWYGDGLPCLLCC